MTENGLISSIRDHSMECSDVDLDNIEVSSLPRRLIDEELVRDLVRLVHIHNLFELHGDARLHGLILLTPCPKAHLGLLATDTHHHPGDLVGLVELLTDEGEQAVQPVLVE
jgi:hypothetical protein